MKKSVTLTVDLQKVACLCDNLARYNGGLGLETQEGLTPHHLDDMMKILVKGDCTAELRDLLVTIIGLHKEAHNKYLRYEEEE